MGVEIEEVKEIFSEDALPEGDLYEKVYILSVEPKYASEYLGLLLEKAPLQDYSLNHLKRIRSENIKVSNSLKKLLKLIICPVNKYDDLDEEVKNICDKKEIVEVPKYEPKSKSQFSEWKEKWPINFKLNEQEKNREQGLSNSELENISKYFDQMIEDKEELKSTVGSDFYTENLGGLIVNPKNGKVVIKLSEALSFLIKKHGTKILTKQFFEMYTPTMACIEGVSAIIREELFSDAIPPNFYLCTQLDLYLTQEPDLMSSMALVHSRIGRVYYLYPDLHAGALGSFESSTPINCLKSLNHHYRAFHVITKSLVD